MRTTMVALMLAGAALPAQALQTPATPALVELDSPSCAPPKTPAADAAATAAPVLVDGLGYAGIEPDTADPEARRWFEQGVRLTWAFDEVEAIRAFAEARKLDPACALCAWGEAWASGPTINLQPRNEEHGKAKAAAARALSLAARLGPRDRALIQAMQARIGRRQSFDNKAYARAMAKLARQFPGDDAILVIAADAQMITFPDKGPGPGSQAQTWLETVLRRNPGHSGAIHMYIHLTDWIDRQDLAEPYAERLGGIAPAASHLVHMPAHTFFGVGRYADAASVNVSALAADRAYEARVRPPASDYRSYLYAHDAHFAIQSALMRGDGRTALEVADHYRSRFPDSETTGFVASIHASAWFAYGLHSSAVLDMPEPPESEPLLRAMRHYARGEALARRGDASGARSEAAAIAALRDGPSGRALGGRTSEKLVEIAERVLEGRAAMIANDPARAAASFRTAMKIQSGASFGFDPPPFWYPVRRSLAAALLASGDAAGAVLQLEASLERWPNDPLALLALARAEKALGRAADSAEAWSAPGPAGTATSKRCRSAGSRSGLFRPPGEPRDLAQLVGVHQRPV